VSVARPASEAKERYPYADGRIAELPFPESSSIYRVESDWAFGMKQTLFSKSYHWSDWWCESTVADFAMSS
jgi:hypothetical protein